MEQDFNLLAQSRANYYTQGSPVQFVRVELLKGAETGEIAVCLTFKNVAEPVISGLAVHFRCKNLAGEVLCEDQFYYENFTAAKGELFGADEAVFVSESAVGSVEVDLEQAFLTDGSAVPLAQYKRVRLPAPKPLAADVAQQLQQRIGKPELTVTPQMLDCGWYCACGAFHPKGEDDAYCSECGSDRILLQNSLSAMLQQSRPAPAPVAAEDATRVAGAVREEEDMTRVVGAVREEEPTRLLTPQEQFAQAYHSRTAEPLEEDDSDMRVVPGSGSTYGQEDDSDMRMASDREARYAKAGDPRPEAPAALEPGDPDYWAERIIRWAPPITAGLCALIVAIGFVVYQFL